jgi:hypothetical protein
MLETSQRNPVGNQPHPVRASHPPEASLASSSAMAARSVDSECKSRVIEPRNTSRRRSLRLHGAGGNIGPPYGLGEADPAGVQEQGKCILGFPRNLGDPVDLRSHLPAGTLRLTKSQARGRGLWHPRERNPRAQGAVPQREGNGAYGMDAGSLSLFIVPTESRETEPEEACE